MADDDASSGPDLLGGPEPTPFPLLAWRDRLALITAIVAAGLAGGLVLAAVTNASGADAYGEFSWKFLGLQLMSLVVPPSTAVLLLVATMVAAFARSDRLGGVGRWALQIVAIVGCLVGGLGVVGLFTYLQSVFVANWDDTLAFGSRGTGWGSGARSASAIASALLMGIPGAVLSVAVAFVAWRVLLWGDVQAGGPDERGPDDADDAASASDREDLEEPATVLADRPPADVDDGTARSWVSVDPPPPDLSPPGPGLG